MATEVDASVIIPARNAAETIGEQLAALQAQNSSYRWELIVVDNGSTDETAEVARSFEGRIPDLRCVAATERAGPAYARNCGASEARGRYLLFCDADDVVQPGWMDALIESLHHSDAVGGLLRSTMNVNEALQQGSGQSLQGGESVALGFRRALTSNFGIRASVFWQLDGFDEVTTPDASEDLDLCIRLSLGGYSLTAVPEAIVWYRPRSEVRSDFVREFRWARQRVVLYKKYRDAGAQRSPVKGLARMIVVVLTAPQVALGRQRRRRWLMRLARVSGHLMGSAKVRTLYL